VAAGEHASKVEPLRSRQKYFELFFSPRRAANFIYRSGRACLMNLSYFALWLYV
jgi:hypothetical protein